MKKIILIVLLSSLNTACAGDLKPFESDGCSVFPDGTYQQKDLWLACCINHDKAYWQGGTYEQRKDADAGMQACIKAVGEPEIAKIMLAGVRVGGSPYFPTSYRWAYGWPYLRGYKALSAEELKKVQTLSKGN